LLLCERRLREGFVGRAATLYGFGIAVSYALVALIAPVSALELTRRALVTAVVVVGALVGVAGLRDAGAERSLDAVTALVREHGVSARALRFARALALVLRLLKAAVAPCAAVGLFALLLRLLGAAT